MAPTNQKSVRLTVEESERVLALLPHFPHARSEAEFNYLQWLLGHRCYAAVATLPGEVAYGGYPPDKLAALLERDVKPVIEFLLAHGRMNSLFAVAPSLPAPGDTNQPAPIILATGFTFDPTVGAELDAFGLESLADADE